MKKFLLFLTAAVGFSMTADAITIYGYQTWQPGAETPFRGPVKFDSEKPGEFTKIADYSNEGVVYSGYYFNYHWYGQMIEKGTQSSVNGLYEIDMNTGEKTLLVKGGTKLIDMTYDYSSGKIYGIQNGNSWFVEFNPADGQRTLLGRFTDGGSDVYMLALAADYSGKIYGISSTDVLYNIDPANGALTKIGDLGVDAGYDQTMTCDYSTGDIYWANNGDYCLYKVDPATGKATLLGALGPDGCSSMGSMFIPFIDAPAEAPDRVFNPHAQVEGGVVSLFWVVPSTNVRGGELKEFSGVRIYRDGELITDQPSSTASIGCECFYEDHVAQEGDYTYSFVPYNSAGDGGVDTKPLKVHVGTDRPGAVNNFTATPTDGGVTLTWEAPTQGATGGSFNASDITSYIVKRNGSKIATLEPDKLSYSETRSFGKYSYSVSATSTTGEGPATTIENVLVKPGDWIVMTTGTELVEPGKEYKFYDEGGPSSNYYNSRNDMLIIKPSVPNAYVTVAFDMFDIETYGDYLEVYQGSVNPGAAIEGELYGKFAANSVPSELKYIESQALSGALSFHFYSDIMETAPGWTARVNVVLRKEKDLAATSVYVPSIVRVGEEVLANVVVVNKGTDPAQNYKVELLEDNQVVATVDGSELCSGASVLYEIPYTPKSTGTVQFTGRVVYEGDLDESNNTTAAITRTILVKDAHVIMHDTATPTDVLVIPASFLAAESMGQTLYDAEFIGITADERYNLISIAFPYSEITKSYDNVPFELWVGETERDELATATVPASELTKVFDGTLNVSTADTHLEFTFDQPYAYNGGRFVYLLHKKDSDTANNGVKFRGCYGYEGTHKNVSRFASNWYAGSDPIDPETTFGYSGSDIRPDIRMIFIPAGAGVENVSVDSTDAPVQYFDLQGRPVANPSTGIYIRRQGSVASKVLIK